VSMDAQADDFRTAGWDEHEVFHLETGRRMSFRAKLQWLEEADRMVRFLAKRRPWIDKEGVLHQPARSSQAAEGGQAEYGSGSGEPGGEGGR